MNEWIEVSDINLNGRFDIFIKYQFARALVLGKATAFHQNAYEEHIRVFNSFLEIDDNGSPVKVGATQFVSAFEALIESISHQGFDKSSAIPITLESTPLNGAHRIATCMALENRVCVSRFDKSFCPQWDYSFFRDRGAQPRFLDAGAVALLDWFKDMRVAVVYGAAFTARDRILEELSQKVTVWYEKTVQLTEIGKANLIRLIYAGENWLGPAKFGYRGALGKSKPCFPSNAPSYVSIIFFRSNITPDELVAVKEHIRAGVSLGKHSIHITDTAEEALKIGSAILNNNGVHLLNNKRYDYCASFEQDLTTLKERLKDSNIETEDLCVVGSSTLAAYGIRDARDMDIIIAPNLIEMAEHEGLEISNAHWEAYSFNIRELIYDPNNYFIYEGIKFLSLDNLIKLKSSRREKKDKVDIALVKLMIDHKSTVHTNITQYIILFRLYSNAKWLRSYIGHWLVRLKLRTRPKITSA